VYAICSTLTTQAFANGGSAAPTTQTLVEATCTPDAPHVIGGGVLPGGSAAAHGATAIAATHPGDGLSYWRVWMDNYSGQAVSVYAVAICSPPL
jgi:hypothetical protein